MRTVHLVPALLGLAWLVGSPVSGVSEVTRTRACTAHQSQQKYQAIAEATEIIGVIKLGLGLVQYMGKVFRELCPDTDCGLAFNPTSEVDRELLQQSKLISQ